MVTSAWPDELKLKQIEDDFEEDEDEYYDEDEDEYDEEDDDYLDEDEYYEDEYENEKDLGDIQVDQQSNEGIQLCWSKTQRIVLLFG